MTLSKEDKELIFKASDYILNNLSGVIFQPIMAPLGAPYVPEFFHEHSYLKHSNEVIPKQLSAKDAEEYRKLKIIKQFYDSG